MQEANNDRNDSFKSGDLINFGNDYGYVVKVEPHNIIYIKWFEYDQTFRYNISASHSAKEFKKIA